MGSEELGPDDPIKEVLKTALSIGFIGLAGSLIALIGKHHGEIKRRNWVSRLFLICQNR